MSTVESTSTIDRLLLEEESLFSRDQDGRLVRMDKVTAKDFDEDVTLLIDGQEVTVKKAVPATDSQGKILTDANGLAIPRATTIYDAASKLYGDRPEGNPIPILCHRDHMNPVAVCRLCVVEISKVKRGAKQRDRKFQPACQHRVEPTMEVQTVESPNDPEARERVRSTVKMLTELLMADHPSPCAKERRSGDCELEALARRFEVGSPRLAARAKPKGRDESSLVIAVDHDACILCDRCVRGCNDIRGNEVIGRMNKGYKTKIAFDLDDPMGSSSCVACGECMISCPTGALTHRSVVQADPWADLPVKPEPISVAALKDHALPEVRRAFSGVSPVFLQWNAGAVVRRRFKKGELICREGSFDSTAFMIEQGSVEVMINTSQKGVGSTVTGRLFRRFTSTFLDRGSQGEQGDGRPNILIDAPVALPSNGAIATMGVGDIFGEMTCMNKYPRSATIRAAENCTVLEMLPNVLYIMQRSPSFRAYLDTVYRERLINNHLRNVPLLAPLRATPELEQTLFSSLKSRVKLRRCEPGEVIFRQGDSASDGFYLVRSGFVKVSESRPGGEAVLNYVGPGGHFGEIGLLSDLPEIRALTKPGYRTATCSALDHVDLVRIAAEDFREIIERFPESLKKPLVERALKALDANWDKLRETRSESLDDFLGQGLMNAQSLLVLDLEKCTRCDECTKACADTHQGVTRLIREGLRFDKFLVASSCRSCLDPYCMVGCPVSAIRRRDTREIHIENWCIGCGKCAENCPYGNINMHPLPAVMTPDPDQPDRKIPVVKQRATMCDLCHDLGPNAEPSCVYACPHDAAHRMSGNALQQIIDDASRF